MHVLLMLSGLLLAVQLLAGPPPTLPPSAVAQLQESLRDSQRHRMHVWRDLPPLNPDGTINVYIEISRGDRRKWELDMERNTRAIDRRMPDDPGGYPVNYGFVPQTVSYDGDPFDVLVLGAPIAGGSIVRGVIVGLMHMEDEKGLDSKVVISRVGPGGGTYGRLTDWERERIGTYFARYKLHGPGTFSKVPGWDTPERGRAFVDMTHAFFRDCRATRAGPCRVRRPPAP